MIHKEFEFQTITPNRELPFRLLIHDTGDEHIVRRHWHTSFEISYVVKGMNENFYIDGKEIVQKQYQIVVINPYQVHGLNLPKSDSRIAITIMLPKEFLISMGIDYRNIQIKNYIESTPTGELNKLFEKLYECTTNNEIKYQKLEQIGIVCLIFTNLLNNWSIEIDPNKIIEISRGLGYLEKTLQWIESNYMKSIKLVDMSKNAQLSTSYFAHLFKKYIQQSPMEYLNIIRLQHAKQLLLNDSKSVNEIAEETGFANYRSFVNSFKRIYKITPKKYQLQHKNKI